MRWPHLWTGARGAEPIRIYSRGAGQGHAFDQFKYWSKTGQKLVKWSGASGPIRIYSQAAQAMIGRIIGSRVGCRSTKVEVKGGAIMIQGHGGRATLFKPAGQQRPSRASAPAAAVVADPSNHQSVGIAA